MLGIILKGFLLDRNVIAVLMCIDILDCKQFLFYPPLNFVLFQWYARESVLDWLIFVVTVDMQWSPPFALTRCLKESDEGKG